MNLEEGYLGDELKQIRELSEKDGSLPAGSDYLNNSRHQNESL